MAINKKYFPAIKALVHELVIGNYDVLEKDGRSGRLTANELEKAIADYGCELVDINEKEFGLADYYPIEGEISEWAIDLPLRTLEEGRSDLTLSFTLTASNNEIRLQIDDLRVL
ncbi:MAG: hypothetical protein S4CHLAM45_13330 [Chlamydiales bacterium]|nr:hypothetical protein [Chlamydiales bacterium]MCH9620595.1 hypothetical protein [Chlamydiales bacterium]MCH9623423.1 hypothetical protein [Chlamydiales bacterium]